MMKFELDEVKNAYRRLKTYIYYDNTDIILRRKLVEFETNLTKDYNSIFSSDEKPYQIREDQDISNLGLNTSKSVNDKLQIFTDKLNNFHNSSGFFDFFLKKSTLNFILKNLRKMKLSVILFLIKELRKNIQ